MFNLAIDSKLRGCDLVRLKVGDMAHGSIIQSRAKIVQQKTLRPVQFEITDQTRVSLKKWIAEAALGSGDCLIPSQLSASPHLSTRQHAQIVAPWIKLIGLDPDCPRGAECLEGARRADIGAVGGSMGEIDPNRTSHTKA